MSMRSLSDSDRCRSCAWSAPGGATTRRTDRWPPRRRGCRLRIRRAPRSCSKPSPRASLPTGGAWRMLGMAPSGRQGSRQGAAAAYRRALEIDPESPQVLYSLGTAYALRQDASAAFQWLERARATRKLDMTQIESDPNLSRSRRILVSTPCFQRRNFLRSRSSRR